jgi:hypothetical protein
MPKVVPGGDDFSGHATAETDVELSEHMRRMLPVRAIVHQTLV